MANTNIYQHYSLGQVISKIVGYPIINRFEDAITNTPGYPTIIYT